jgi:hypothetical protein
VQSKRAESRIMFVKTHKGLRKRWTLDLAEQRERVATRDSGNPIFDRFYTFKSRQLMAKVSSNRTFNGRLYLIDNIYSTKERAQFYAKAHRYEGRKARVIPSKHGYILYVRLEQ